MVQGRSVVVLKEGPHLPCVAGDHVATQLIEGIRLERTQMHARERVLREACERTPTPRETPSSRTCRVRSERAHDPKR